MAVTSGLWKRGPTRSARTFRIESREVCGYELVLGGGQRRRRGLFERRLRRVQDPSDGRGDGGELRVAAALLSGARKSEKLAAAFEVLGPDALDLNGVARLLRAALASIAFATDATDISQAINREAASLAEDVCANAPGTKTKRF